MCQAVSCANITGVNEANTISALMEFPFGDRLSERRVTIGEVACRCRCWYHSPHSFPKHWSWPLHVASCCGRWILRLNRTIAKVPCWGTLSLLRDDKLILRLPWGLSPLIGGEVLEARTTPSLLLCTQYLGQQRHPVNVEWISEEFFFIYHTGWESVSCLGWLRLPHLVQTLWLQSDPQADGWAREHQSTSGIQNESWGASPLTDTNDYNCDLPRQLPTHVIHFKELSEQNGTDVWWLSGMAGTAGLMGCWVGGGRHRRW